MISRSYLGIGCAVLLAACSSPRSSLPHIADLYKEAAQREARNPVIVIHGILGARLEQKSTGKTVWGAFTSDGIDPNDEMGVRALGLPLEIPGPIGGDDGAATDVVATGPLEALRLNLLFTVVSVNVYANIIRTLGAGGYTDRVLMDPQSPAYATDHFTCFSFFYDWRKDNVENAIRLGEFMQSKRIEVQRSARAKIERLRASGKPDELVEARELEEWLARGFRFDIVAHSMGGLVARYYLRYGMQDLPADGSLPRVTWAGAQEVDRLIMVGTPNLGSMDALRTLVEGFTPSFILPHFHATLVATMPSIYQLLPRTRHHLVLDESGEPTDLDLFDPEVWERNRWGLMDPDGARYREWLAPGVDSARREAQAQRYLAWCLARAQQFQASLDVVPEEPCRTQTYLFASDTESTLTRTRLRHEGDRSVPTFTDAELYGPGDATVARYSAIGDERGVDPMRNWLRPAVTWANVTFLADDHIGLTSNPYFSDNTLFLLLENEPPRL